MALSDIPLDVRRAACALVKKRFAGRKDLERATDRDSRDTVSLVKLEIALGLATEDDLRESEAMRAEFALNKAWADTWYKDPEIENGQRYIKWTPRGRTIAALLWLERANRPAAAARLYASGGDKQICQWVAFDACGAIDSLRLARKAARDRTGDKLFARMPGYAEHVIARRRAARLIKAAGFRGATHSHSWTIVTVERGQERAVSTTGSVRPQDVGLSNAYARKAFFVTTSEHVWYVSTAILTPDVRALNEHAQDMVYLTTELRVVQGRGTSLTMQRRGIKGGWS